MEINLFFLINNMDEPSVKYFDKSKYMIGYILETNVETESELRPKATQLNYHKDVKTAIYGTAPYLGGGIKSDKFNVENTLKYDKVNDLITCDRTTEKRTQRDTYNLSVPKESGLSTYWPRSSRVDYRNSLNDDDE